MLNEFFDLEELLTAAKLGVEDEDQEEQLDLRFNRIFDLIFNYESLIKDLKRWHMLLSLDGMNTKHQVLVDIEEKLENFKNEEV